MQEMVSESVCFHSMDCLISSFKKNWLEETKVGVLVYYLKVLIQPRNCCGLRGSMFRNLSLLFFFSSWGLLGRRKQDSGVSSSLRGLSEPKVGELKSELIRLSELVCTWECVCVFIHSFIHSHIHICMKYKPRKYTSPCEKLQVHNLGFLYGQGHSSEKEQGQVVTES